MIGKQILHFKVLAVLGRGGMGVVYKAEDTRLVNHLKDEVETEVETCY